MKLKLFALFFLASVLASFAQTKEEKCAEDIQYYVGFAKAKDYTAAYEYLQNLRKNCPTTSKALYLYGRNILEDKASNATTPEDKEKFVRDLLALNNEFDVNFPGNGEGNTMRNGMYLLQYEIGTKDEALTLLDNAFKNDKDNFNSPKALYTYFELYVNAYEAGKNGITLQNVFDKYDEITEKKEVEEKKLSEVKDALLKKEDAGEELSDKEKKNFKNTAINLESFEIITESMDNKIMTLSSCDKLIPFYNKSFDANKGNAEWLQRAANRLSVKGCTGDPLFLKISEALHKLQPSAKSAYYLGVLAEKNKNITKAIEFFNQSADLHTDNTEKAKVYYKIATVYGGGNKGQARNYARKALAVKPSFGRAYLLIANLYAGSINDCGNSPFDKRAVYWLCAQYAQKAAAVDSSLAGTANSAASKYRQNAPSKSEIFQEAKAGQRICFDCWIGECITVPSL